MQFGWPRHSRQGLIEVGYFNNFLNNSRHPWDCSGTTAHADLRSNNMRLYSIVYKKDDDWETVNELGKQDCLHFVDLNRDEQPHRLPYAFEIKQAEETERRVR